MLEIIKVPNGAFRCNSQLRDFQRLGEHLKSLPGGFSTSTADPRELVLNLDLSALPENERDDARDDLGLLVESWIRNLVVDTRTQRWEELADGYSAIFRMGSHLYLDAFPMNTLRVDPDNPNKVRLTFAFGGMAIMVCDPKAKVADPDQREVPYFPV